MTDRVRGLLRLAPLGLVLALAIAWQLPEVDLVQLGSADPATPEPMTATLDSLPDDPVVLVGFDPDIGTYAEIRPTVRALIADLLARDGRLAFVSLTPEGRAIGSAELARLGRGDANPTRLLDLGFIAGAEAGLVDLARGLRVPDAADGAFARQLVDEGVTALDAVAIVGGNDLGPRSWVEQVAPRIGEIPFVAVTPTVLLPEVQPYVSGGQLAAVIGTPRDGATYRDGLELGNLDRFAESTDRDALPVLVGLLVALAVLGQALAGRLLDMLRSARSREAA
jgi:hypothetical protein